MAAHRTRDNKELVSPEQVWSGTASWPRSMDTRPTGLWPKRGNAASATLTNPTESRIAQQAVTYARDHSSSVPPCWTGATFWKRR